MPGFDEVYRELFKNPKDTLRRTPIAVMAGHHGAGRYTSSERTVKGFTTGLSGLVGVKKDRDRFDFLHAGAVTGHANLANGEVEAYYFAMNQDVVGMNPNPATNYLDIPRVPTLNDPKIVWTGQLSACHVGIWKLAPHNTIRLCHIQPMTATQAQAAHLPSTSPAIHKHIDDTTLPLMAPLHAPRNITVHPKMGPTERATLDKVYFLGAHISQKWRFFVTHFSGDGKEVLKVEELKDGTYQY